MILPKHKLTEIDYYEVIRDNKKDTIVIFWNKWYKFSSSFIFVRDFVSQTPLEDGHVVTTTTASFDYRELADQLKDYFKD
jgi:hypothetical protein